MSDHPSKPVYTPVTLADLAREGRVIWLYCCECGHEAEPKPDALGLPMSTPVPDVSRALKCSKCGSRNTCSRPQLHDKPLAVIRAAAQGR